MSTLNNPIIFIEYQKIPPEIIPIFASWPGAMVNLYHIPPILLAPSDYFFVPELTKNDIRGPRFLLQWSHQGNS